MSLTRGLVYSIEHQFGGATPGVATMYDLSRYRSNGVMTNVTWGQAWTPHWHAVFNGTSSLIDTDVLDTPQLNFITQKYTIMGWVNWIDTTQSEILIGRYHLDNHGWELYFTFTGGVYSLTQRHHHAGTIVDANPRSASFSVAWDENTVCHMAVVFNGNGTDCSHYKNGVALAVTSSTGGIRNPESADHDLVVGARYTKDANWYEGWHAKLNIYNYAWTHGQICQRYEAEKYLAGIPR